eukprot:2220217-Rhodomonas_salina.1
MLAEEIRLLSSTTEVEREFKDLLFAKCTDLFKRNLEAAAKYLREEAPSGTEELFKLMLSLVCSTQEGLEVHGRDSEVR